MSSQSANTYTRDVGISNDSVLTMTKASDIYTYISQEMSCLSCVQCHGARKQHSRDEMKVRVKDETVMVMPKGTHLETISNPVMSFKDPCDFGGLLRVRLL